MNDPFDWPIPPHFELVAPPGTAGPAPGVVVTNEGKRLSGKLLFLDMGASMVEFQPDKAQGKINIGFSSLKWLCLTEPIQLKRQAPLANMQQERAERDKCSVHFKDGDALHAQTAGFILRDAGLFLFLLNAANHVTRWFIPAEAIKTYEIGDKLGRMLIDKNILSQGAVDAGLEKQTELRSRKIGDYLTRDEIVTQQQVQAALKLQQSRPQLKLGEALLQENIITQAQLDKALAKQAEDRRVALGEILVAMGVVDRETIRRVLSHKLGIPTVNLRRFQIDLNAIKTIPASLAHKHAVVPLYRTDTRMAVAMENPLAWSTMQEIEFFSQLKVDPVMASREELLSTIQRYYGELDERENLSDLLSELDAAPKDGEAATEEVVAESDNTLVRLVNRIITDAVEQGASDIHIESMRGNRPSKVRFRKDGVMMPYSEIPANFRAAIVFRIKIMSDLDVTERRRSQDGKISFDQYGGKRVELRVTTMPTADGLEDVVMRILAEPRAASIDSLGLLPEVLARLKPMVLKQQGLLLVCGPTGSGKTTTLHSLLAFINTPDRKIWTAEDPIEITQEGLRQVQVNPKIGWTFAAVLRSFLRLDPDVIMVGETRDIETARTIVEASLTGHLVVSTMHTNGAAESVVRLLDFGLDPFNFSDALLGVVGQRLVRKLCASCRKARPATADELNHLASQYCSGTEMNPAEVLERWRTRYAHEAGGLSTYRADGCASCSRSGYKGRIGVYELLTASPAVKRKIYSRASVPELLQTALAEGMMTLRQDGIEKVVQGLTDLPQIEAVCM